MASDHHERHVGASQGSSGKYGGKVFPQSSSNTVTGSSNPWVFDISSSKSPFILDGNSGMTHKWSSFRSFFKTSKTVAEFGGGLSFGAANLRFAKDYMRNDDNKSNNSEAGRREDDTVLITKDNINDSYQDVFFIDNGPFVATSRSTTNNQTQNFDINTASDFGEGITNWTSSNVGRINLGLGPLEPDKWWKPDRHGGEGDGNYWQTWGDGTKSTRQSYSKYDPLLKGITAGHKFRWKEDPSKTIYTTYGSWTVRNYKRYIQIGRAHV